MYLVIFFENSWHLTKNSNMQKVFNIICQVCSVISPPLWFAEFYLWILKFFFALN